MKPYTPRQKKAIIPVIQMKIIRIDHRTQIEVSASIPDDVAIERYYQKHTTVVRPPIIVHGEIPQEELAAVIDDSDLPDQE